MFNLILIVAIGVAFLVLERLWPASQLPRVRGWWARVAVVNFCQLGIVALAGQTWDRWMQGASLLHLGRHMDDVTAALIAYGVSCVIYYGWHRVRHESAWFWRVCHQLHHSPRRIEVLTSFYKHPAEIALNSMLSSAIVYPLLGCSVRAAAIYTLLIAVAEYFYHWNVRTPRWLGWLIQRPESHRVHHEYRRHTKNYADLPVIDWLFGTLENPSCDVRRCGFNPRREARFDEMLAARDVHKVEAWPGFAPTCFGCRKRWACQMMKETSTRREAA
jgi:sterol desaturase/sphingolipid hydroxylase (fatty acid hydroxylase superfamily)